jgi:hypothetical protein
MDVDAPPTTTAPAPSSPIALPVLATVRAARARHGLRTGDYGRYRCVRWVVVGVDRTGFVCDEAHRSVFSPPFPSLPNQNSAYCTRKLGRLYRNLKLTHGRGKYQKRPIDAATVTEDG